MVSPFLAPGTAWHMMHKKSDAMGITQWVALLLDWLRAATIEPLQGIATLTSVDLADATLTQRQKIRTILVPSPPPPQSLSHPIPLQQDFQMQAPAPPISPKRQAV